MGEYRTLVDVIERSTREHAARPALGTKRDGTWQFITYEELGNSIARMRAGLSSLGVQPGDKVAIVADNREEWVVVACATYGVGAQLVPMYQAQLPREWAYILRDCGAKVVFAATDVIAEQLGMLRGQLPALKHIVSFEDGDHAPGYGGLLRLGTRDTVLPQPEDLAGFIYTSGTTGMPKGVLLSHANVVSNINAVHRIFKFEPSDRSLSFLPWAHSFGQVGELYMLLSMGCSIAINDELPRLVDNMLEVHPTVLFAVPRVFNKLYASVHHQMREKPAFVQHLFEDGLHLATDRAHGSPLRLLQKAELLLSDRLVFSRVREKFGGKLKYAISASAALSPVVAEFVQALGITVFEGYGLTETSPVVSVNYPGHHKLGSVGQPIPGVHVVIDTRVSGDAQEGEIIVYGPNVMKGYHRLPEETERALTADGGLRTGDLGHIDDEGYIFITGRIKEQYKLENGKYVMPAPLEEQLKLSPLVANVIVYGDNRPYNVALVVPNLEALQRSAKERGIELASDVTSDPRARELMQRELDQQGKDFRGFEKPRRCALLSEDFTLENGLLTPTLKLKRAAVVTRYAAQLDALYAEAQGIGQAASQSPLHSA